MVAGNKEFETFWKPALRPSSGKTTQPNQLGPQDKVNPILELLWNYSAVNTITTTAPVSVIFHSHCHSNNIQIT
jgi:hypothetical protein